MEWINLAQDVSVVVCLNFEIVRRGQFAVQMADCQLFKQHFCVMFVISSDFRRLFSCLFIIPRIFSHYTICFHSL